jgi:hypothetical protein
MNSDRSMTLTSAGERGTGGRSQDVAGVVVRVGTPASAGRATESSRWFFRLFLVFYFTFLNCRWWEIIEALVS